MLQQSLYGCYNRASFRETVRVQDGYTDGGSHRIAHMVEAPFRLSRGCEYAKTDLGKVDRHCLGCEHRRVNESQKSSSDS